MIEAFRTKFALKNGPNKSQLYAWNSPVFLFANENIHEYLQAMYSLNGKDVLAVGASGDHAFECILAGAKNVDVFDVNYLQKHVIELKQKMISHLPYADFMRFFFEDRTFFSYEIIRPIWNILSPGLQEFLNYYYSNRNKNLFRYRGAQHKDYRMSHISYVECESDYKELARMMPENINFTECDIAKITAKIEKKYDTILLSNIYEYVNENITDSFERLNRFYDSILSELAENNLNTDNGQIAFGYAWRSNLAKWQDLLACFQQYQSLSINNFSENVHRFDTASVSTVAKDDALVQKPDVVMIMTQNTR